MVKITSGDVSGWGESGKLDPPEPITATIKYVFAKRIIGKSIQPRVISDELYSFSKKIWSKRDLC